MLRTGSGRLVNLGGNELLRCGMGSSSVLLRVRIGCPSPSSSTYLIDWHTASIVLVCSFGKHQFCGKGVLAAVARSRWSGRRRQVVAVEIDVGHGLVQGTDPFVVWCSGPLS
jgi:hypothetical protein